LNLYCYCINNPIKYVDPSGNGIEGLVIITLISLIAIALVVTKNEHPILKETSGYSQYEPPTFLTLDNEGLTLVNFSTGTYKKNWWLSEEYDISFYSSLPTAEVSIKIPATDSKNFFDYVVFSLNFGSFGFDGRYLDIGLISGIEFRGKFQKNIFSVSFDGFRLFNDLLNGIN